jgi:alpha-L-rhamnosidase
MTQFPTLSVRDVRAARLPVDVAVPTSPPVLSWKCVTSTSEWMQQSAVVRVEGENRCETTTVGRESVDVPWPFQPLLQGEVVTLTVQVTGADGATSERSAPLVIRTAFLDPGAWHANFIRAGGKLPADAVTSLRKEFELSGVIASATLYSAAQGVYQVRINENDVDDAVLKPGWTSYQFRLVHETTDVTRLLSSGRNVLDITVAGGWYTERYSDIGPGKPFYGTRTAAAAQIVIVYEDGRSEEIVTDDTWSATTEGPMRSSGIYAGESFDARRSLPVTAEWDRAEIARVDIVPVPRSAPSVRRTQEVPVAEILETPSGRTVLDFAQNLVGRVRITVAGERGHRITLRHAEALEEGEIATRPLRSAAATDMYILSGEGVETWEPGFTFHGFRYVEVDNWPGPLNADAVVAVVVHSDMERTGHFESSDAMINRLHANAVWSMRGNFLSLPTDCPQRDERFGWTGDIQAFAPAASYLFDSASLLSSWLEDLWLEQNAAGGVVPFIVPDVLGGGAAPIAAWGDAATVVPWTLYNRFGSRDVLVRQFESMSAWVDVIEEAAGSGLLWESGFQFGDWLDPDAPFDDPGASKTDVGIVATAQLYRSARILADAAEVIGRLERGAKAAELADRVRCAFLATYVTPRGRMVSDSPTSYALAIAYDIVDDPTLRSALGDRLAYLVRSSGYHISTGFIGTTVIQDALTSTGHGDAAGRLFTQTENPSWLYPVTMGATTIWERWDSMLEDGSINPGEMTSFNHYALGSVVDWMHRTVAGLAPAAPGYRRIRIAPEPLPTLQHARTSLETPYGLASAGWRRTGAEEITVSAVIPPSTCADVTLPGADHSFSVGSGSHEWVIGTAPARQPAPLTPQSTLAQIVDDREAYRIVIEAIERLDPAAAAVFRKRTKWIESRVLIDDFTELAPDLKAAVEDAITRLSAARAGAE